jgi:segregation and condensation protein A
MEKLCYKLESFEGPLDLLLLLIKKNKMNIFDIRITELVDQYMEQIDAMQERNMEVSSEFLEMAAHLVYMKTVFLLPKKEEAEQLSRELSGRLLEYEECRRIAKLLGEKLSFDTYTREQEKIEFDTRYKGTIALQDLFNAYRSAVGRGNACCRRSRRPSPELFPTKSSALRRGLSVFFVTSAKREGQNTRTFTKTAMGGQNSSQPSSLCWSL